MRGNKKTLFAVAALAVAAALMLGLWQLTRPQAQAGDKTVVVEVVHADESRREFTCRTGEEYLGPLLLEEKLAEGEMSAYGHHHRGRRDRPGEPAAVVVHHQGGRTGGHRGGRHPHRRRRPL